MRHDRRSSEQGRGAVPTPTDDVAGAARGGHALRGHRYETARALQGMAAAGAGQVAPGRGSGPLDAMGEAAAALHGAHGAAIDRGAAAIGVPAASVAAIVLAETSALGAIAADGMALRFEPHAFWQQTGRWVVATHRDQAAEATAFAEAQRIDRSAAYAAARFGLGQVAGSEAARAGFASAEAMAAAMAESPAAQIEGLVRVVGEDPGLREAAGRQDWDAMAALRAGPAWVALGYHDALAAGAAAWDELAAAAGPAHGDGDGGGGGGRGGGGTDDAAGDGTPRRRRRREG